MSEHSLPDDVRRWPNDPAELLGVPADVDRKELRRAYSRLIRRFKPEHAPDQFQRIREAYESMLNAVSWREAFHSPESGDDVESPATISSHDGDSPRPDASTRGGRTGARADQLQELWQSAANGKFEAAYRGLADLYEIAPGDEDVALRLYWLLKLEPKLDPRREPVDRLTAVLRRGGLPQRALSLYLVELLEDPSLAAQPRAAELLHSNGPTWAISQLACAQIRAAGRVKSWTAIRDCLDAVRSRISLDEEASWLRVLATALGCVVWSTEPPTELERSIRRELNELEHLQLSFSHEFDRVECLVELARDCRGSAGKRGIIRRLLPFFTETWEKSGYECRRELLLVLEPWIRDRDRGLKDLDALQDSSPVGFSRIVELIETAGFAGREFDQSDESEKRLKNRLLRSLARQNWPYYLKYRRPLRDFCLDEGIALNTVIRLLAEHPDYFGIPPHDDQLLQQIAADEPLNCLLSANLAFWAG